jgi:hypothetical protein
MIFWPFRELRPRASTSVSRPLPPTSRLCANESLTEFSSPAHTNRRIPPLTCLQFRLFSVGGGGPNGRAMKSAEEPSVVPLGLTSTRFAFHNLGSNNGTMVNGRRIGTQESILLHDDTVSIDQLMFQIDLSRSALVPSATCSGCTAVPRKGSICRRPIESRVGRFAWLAATKRDVDIADHRQSACKRIHRMFDRTSP